MNVRSGSAQPFITLGNLRNFEVGYHSDLGEQRRIAGILSAYDDLIENNQRRIRILEDMARSLYREWFAHFRYPGHENERSEVSSLRPSVPLVDSPLGQIPQGWTVRNVKDIANVTYGCALKSQSFNADGNGLPVVRIRDIPTGASETYSAEECNEKYRINNGHILVGMDGDFHMCIWSNGLALQNQRVARFESQGEIGNYHLFLALERPIQEFNMAIVGTTVAHLGDMHIKTIPIIWPTSALRKKAKEILEPVSEQIIALKRQTSNLRRTRDLLLPRLLSGQVIVAAMESELSEVTT
jgi:type I restriction enzyme S subunit